MSTARGLRCPCSSTPRKLWLNSTSLLLPRTSAASVPNKHHSQCDMPAASRPAACLRDGPLCHRCLQLVLVDEVVLAVAAAKEQVRGAQLLACAGSEASHGRL